MLAIMCLFIFICKINIQYTFTVSLLLDKYYLFIKKHIKDQIYFQKIIDKALFQYSEKNDLKELDIRFENIDFNFEEPDKFKTIKYLKTTVGYEALLNILADILEVEKLNKFESIDVFIPYLERCNNIDFGNTNLYTFSNRGKKILYLTMSLAIFPPTLDNLKDHRKQELSTLLIA